MSRYSFRSVNLEEYKYIRTRVNRALKRFVRKYKGKVEYASFLGLDRLEYYKHDRIHLNSKGYSMYCSKIISIINKHKIN